jgi:ERCC4-related helicase
MTYEIVIQNIEVSAEKFKSIELYLSEEEYEQIKLDNTAFIQAIMAALEASDGN